MDTARIKQETGEAILFNNNDKTTSLSSSSSSESSDDELSCVEQNPKKRPKITYSVLPVGFLDPLPLQERPLAPRKPIVTDKNGVVVSVVNPLSSSSLVKEESAESDNAAWLVKEKAVVISTTTTTTTTTVSPVMVRGCKQFWKAGDYEGTDGACSVAKTAGMDHVRVHPKFLHSNATSHKWALGAFAELLDNALDEVCSGATYVLVDVLENMKDHNKMLLVEDNGGGMTPDKMRQCMSLGYSAKSKMANTIGQYGNGFKTSTMRLGADVIVFSRCQVKNGGSTTQSIGMLSYTFLRSTGKEDIVVPMIHYEKVGETWNKQVNYSSNYWQTNLESIVMWSPYESEEDLLDQFNSMKDQGTRIIIYNLWEDDQGSLELDFDTDLHDIQIRGVSRDEKKIQMAKVYPNSRHFLTYRHSLRSYASILYYKIPPGFQIILRGEKVDHHNIVDDMMHTKEITYKPLLCADSASKDLNMVAVVKIGFVKDAEHHIDIQGFNVYHKNRLIKPFWRVWNAAGSDGRGVIGVLEANFVEPAHDKQGFERTVVLSRLESKLVSVQKTYWSTNCQLIGYAERRRAKTSISPDKVSPADAKDKCNSTYNANGNINSNHTFTFKTTGQTENRSSVGITHRSPVGTTQYQGQARYCGSSSPCPRKLPSYRELEAAQNVPVKTKETNRNGSRLLPLRATPDLVLQLKEENNLLRTRLKKFSQDLQYEKEKNKSLQNQVIEMKQKMDKMDEEQETFVSCFSEERKRRDTEEENLRRKIKEASEVIQQLIKKEKL